MLVKAAAGGGGKGMRIVRTRRGLDEAVAAAKREALTAFGDDTMLVEKYVEHGRHIEVQVIADEHGNVMHLFERDCSIQRRHQKVLEEAPATTISEPSPQVTDIRGGTGARGRLHQRRHRRVPLDIGTDEAYFLEMNTRLQVEHPVTEAVTGLDLVGLQLGVLQASRCRSGRSDVTVSGHAIEARVYAEDPTGIPAAGRTARPGALADGARVDAALESGQASARRTTRCWAR